MHLVLASFLSETLPSHNFLCLLLCHSIMDPFDLDAGLELETTNSLFPWICNCRSMPKHN